MSSGMGTLLVQILLVPWVCSWILTPGRFPRLSRPAVLGLAVAFLVGSALAMEGMEWSAKPHTFYEVLDIDRSAVLGPSAPGVGSVMSGPSAELAKAYRRQSLRFHPDKNKSPEAALRLQEVQTAYDALSDPTYRNVYERYGAEAARASMKSPASKAMYQSLGEGQLILQAASFYGMWALLTFLMTVGKESGQARTWSFIGLVLMAGVEFQIQIGAWDPFSRWFPRTPLSEHLALLHALYPPIMHGVRLIASAMYRDVEGQLFALLAGVLESNREILISLEQLIQASQQQKKAGGGKAVAAGGAEAGLGGPVAPVPGAPGLQGSAALTGDEALPLAARLRRRAEMEQRAMAAAKLAKQSQGGGFGIPSWAIMLGLSIFLNYLK